MLKNPDGTDAEDPNRDVNLSMADLSTLGMSDPADFSNLDHPSIMRSNAFAAGMENTSAQSGQDTTGQSLEDTFSFDMIALGLEEPLPTSDITDEL